LELNEIPFKQLGTSNSLIKVMLMRNTLGICIWNGNGDERDPVEAVRYLKLAADQGHADAQFYIGVCHANSQGTELDPTEATRYFKLTDQGHADAQFNLAQSHEDGIGVERDIATAIRFYALAAQGHQGALEKLNELQ
jgi:TPR repeat protein